MGNGLEIYFRFARAGDAMKQKNGRLCVFFNFASRSDFFCNCRQRLALGFI